jgi:PEP-CTERM motif
MSSTRSGSASATANVTGGAGGNGSEFPPSNGGNGGNGTANASATAGGGGPANAAATAAGGAGGTAPIAPGIAGVDGKAAATASATTDGGAKAQSLATATGSAARAQSTSQTSLGLVSLAKTVAAATTESKVTTNAIVQAGGAGQFLVNPGQSAYAFATALPDKSYSTALIGGASNVADALLGPRDVVFGTSILGANLSGDGSVSNTYSASSTFDFAYKGDLVLGLIAPLDGAPTDFQQIDFTVTLDGAEVVDETFTSLAAADAFFDDHVLDLGAVSGISDVTFSYDLVAGAAGGYGMDLAFGGAVPEPSTWAMMLIGFGGLGYATARRAEKSRSALKQPA